MLNYLRLLRVHQWHKNAFVLLGFFLLGDYQNFQLLQRCLMVAAAFCLISSAVYIVNDYRDRAVDREHPIKRHRPLAAGQVASSTALMLAALLGAAGLSWAYFQGGLTLLILGGYVLNNLVYTFFTKQVAIVDVFQVAFGFMLRIFAGTTGVGIFISEWMVITGFMLSLFIGFAKRYSELANSDAPQRQRRVLQFYSPEMLRAFVNIMAAATIVTYALYTLSPRSVELHGSTNLIYTTPIVVFGILRFLYLLFTRPGPEDPTSYFIKDMPMLLTIFLWAVTYGLLISS